MKLKLGLPKKFGFVCLAIWLFLWACAAARHALLQSNAYDLGLFDQWIWLISNGLPPYSSMEGVHILADHGAWVLYIAGIPYKLHSSIQWLLISQAAGLSLTAIPLWFIGTQTGLPPRLCWLVCGLWWLQPVVFNANIFDFHPETWLMPALAGCYWANRAKKPWLWFALLVLLIGSRDGLVLVVAGIGLEQALRKRWVWAGAAIGLALGWLAMLNRFLYPLLTGSAEGPKAVKGLFSYLGNSLDEVIINLVKQPHLLIQNVDLVGGLIYLLLISVAIGPFWRRVSIPVLIGALPLICVNLLSEQAPQRSLIHHYSLPIGVIVVIAAIDGLAINPRQTVPWKKLAWSALCWAVLAKPWFFSGPYLERLNVLGSTKEAIMEVPEKSRVATTSYLVPHLSQRVSIKFPKPNEVLKVDDFDVLLLNPKDPGWGSDKEAQDSLLIQAKESGWACRQWAGGIELCKK